MGVGLALFAWMTFQSSGGTATDETTAALATAATLALLAPELVADYVLLVRERRPGTSRTTGAAVAITNPVAAPVDEPTRPELPQPAGMTSCANPAYETTAALATAATLILLAPELVADYELLVREHSPGASRTTGAAVAIASPVAALVDERTRPELPQPAGMASCANPAYDDLGGSSTAERARSTTVQALEARQDPESLIGKDVHVDGKGNGMVTGVRRVKGKPTKHLVAFGSNSAGSSEPVLLQKRTGDRGLKFYLLQEEEEAPSAAVEHPPPGPAALASPPAHVAAAPDGSTANETAGLPGPQHIHRACSAYFVLVTLFAAGSALQLASVLESDGGPAMDGGFDSFIVIFAGATAVLVLCRDNISRHCLRRKKQTRAAASEDCPLSIEMGSLPSGGITNPAIEVNDDAEEESSACESERFAQLEAELAATKREHSKYTSARIVAELEKAHVEHTAPAAHAAELQAQRQAQVQAQRERSTAEADELGAELAQLKK
jgi:hypothetical protein